MDLVRDLIAHPVLPHLYTVGGVILALFAVTRLLIDKRQPGNTLAWLLAIILMPYIGAPLFLWLGGRKVRRLVERKSRVMPSFEAGAHVDLACQISPTVQTINSISACPPVGGNSQELITTGEQAFATLEREILNARKSIEITTFILARDEVGKRLIALLAKRAREGIRVRLLLDALGCFRSSGGFVQPLRDAGGQVAKFMPVLPLAFRQSANLRNHRKIAVFDQHTAIIGGHNLAREYMGPTSWNRRWSDFGAVIRGPAASLLHEVFLADWAFATGESLDKLHDEIDPAAMNPEGDIVLQVVASGPDVEGDPLYEGIIAMIQDARESIWIVTPYFIPDEVLWRSLIVKARAGTDVTLIMPAKSNHPITDYARRHYTRELRRAGASVRLFTPGMLHSKAIIVDNRIALLGSANFDQRSLFVNFEIGVFIHTRSECEKIKAWAESLIPHTQPPPERSRKLRVLRGLAEDFSRLLGPLL